MTPQVERPDITINYLFVYVFHKSTIIFLHTKHYIKNSSRKDIKTFLEEFIRWLYYIYKNNYPIVAEPVPSLQSATEALTEICSLNVKVTVYATPAPSKCSATEFKVTVTLS